jgi:predicted metal-dependent peptidase
MTRTNPRYNHTGFFLPSLHNVELGHFVFILDSSSSVSNSEASDMMSEFRSILETFRDATVTVLHVDTRVAFHETYESLEDLPATIDVKGRGGTDFKPGFEWIEENLIEKGEDIAGVIYATDGECSSFPEEPDYPVIWIMTRTPRMQYRETPFGEVTYYDEN